jgi:hypothetical protein
MLATATLKRIYLMSRQYPDFEDIEYLIEWAENKIIQMAQKDRAMNFVNVADLARAVAFYLNSMDTISDSSQIWLSRRISDSHYALSDMRRNEVGSAEFSRSEVSLIDTLKYIASYYEENGCPDPRISTALECSSSSSSAHKVWRPPSRWLDGHSEESDSIQ